MPRALVVMVLCGALVAGCSRLKGKDHDLRDDQPAPAPFSLTGSSHATGQRQLVDTAIAQARAEGKLVLFRLSGAWCPPCQILDLELTAGKAKLAPALGRYETVFLDEVFFERVIGIDFLAGDIAAYPVYYVYNPKTGAWSSFSISGGAADPAGTLASVLDAFADKGEIGTLTKQRFDAMLASDVVDDYSQMEGASVGEAVMSAIMQMGINNTSAETHAALAALKQVADEHPERKLTGNYENGVRLAENYLVATGKETPGDALAFLDGIVKSHADYQTNGQAYYSVYLSYIFRPAVVHLVNTLGLAAAADQCPALASQLKDVPGDSPARSKLREVMCATLAVEAGQMPQAAALAVAADAEGDAAVMALLPYNSLERLHWQAGDLNGAADWAEKNGDVTVAAMNDSLPAAQKAADAAANALADATAAGKPEAELTKLAWAKRSAERNNKSGTLLRARTDKAYKELAALLRAGKVHPVLEPHTEDVVEKP